ncbi:hypothetical protein EYF18_15935 [Shigella flexneri]|nr:hypothetical protein [Shigella flexneri]EGA6740554.1 hypothetical protein [Shigella flexneri]
MHYSFLRIKSAKHQSIDGEKSPCRDGLKVSTATKSRRCAPGSTTSTIRRCSTAQTLPDAESYARGHLLRDAERCTHRSLHP